MIQFRDEEAAYKHPTSIGALNLALYCFRMIQAPRPWDLSYKYRREEQPNLTCTAPPFCHLGDTEAGIFILSSEMWWWQKHRRFADDF